MTASLRLSSLSLLAGAPNVYQAGCSNDVYGSGPERLYRYVAPAAGRARLRLDQGAADLTLAVFDSCGDPATQTALGCSSVYGVEEIDEGFSDDDVGPFTLTAELHAL